MARILLVEDDKFTRELYELLLKEEGHKVESAEDGEIGLKMALAGGYDLILLDIIMPNKDGIGMIIDLKKEFPGVKIIAMSGGGVNRPEGYLDGAKKLGANRTLTKPIDRDQMLMAVKDTLKGDSTVAESPA